MTTAAYLAAAYAVSALTMVAAIKAETAKRTTRREAKAKRPEVLRTGYTLTLRNTILKGPNTTSLDKTLCKRRYQRVSREVFLTLSVN
jgi:hypothetical protein